MPIDIEFASKFNPIEEPYEQALERRISSILGTFKDAMIIAECMKIQQNKLQQAHKFKIGDIVLVYDASKQNVHGDKFSSRWNGPVWISRKLGNDIYKVRNQLGEEYNETYHAYRLRHYKQRL